VQPAANVTEEDYLEAERRAETKHEYLAGQVHAMSGASPRHNLIAMNLTTLVSVALKGKPCRPFGSDQRIHVTDMEHQRPRGRRGTPRDRERGDHARPP
jgi:Uma2 family endonuclease